MKPDRERSGSFAGESTRSVVIGTAGHIDHGKTALVFALTGTDTDRLPEEKSRGITIDLGFASLRLKAANGEMVDVSLIDVPGHQAFVRNMLAGTGGIDCVLLVIAADEGVRAQTEEHLAICSLLGIRRGVVVLTKMDAVTPERLSDARDEVERFVEPTFLHDAAVVAVSSLTRQGIPELQEELARLLSQIPEREAERIARLPVDRAFTVKGFGTVVTGTLQSGSMRADDVFELQPAERLVRVRSVQVHGRVRKQAQAPSRVALNLSGVEVAEVRRGDVLLPPKTLAATSIVDAEIAMLPGAERLRHRSKVRVHAFASETLATALIYDAALDDGGTVLARLRLTKPMVLAPGDRFVLRQLSPARTIGGGCVLDATPLTRLRRSATQQWLQQVRGASVVQQLLLRVQRRGLAGISIGQLVRETGLTPQAIADRVRPLLSSEELTGAASVHPVPERLLSQEFLSGAKELLIQELSRSNRSIARAELRSKMRLEPWVFDLAVARLREEKRLGPDHDLLSLDEENSKISGKRDQRLADIEGMFAAAALASPILSEVSGKLRIGAKDMHAMITQLLREKRLVRMGADDLLVHSDAVARLIAELRQHRGESFDVPRFKMFTGLTRKHAIPLLEYLDGARVMRNSNGIRVVL